MKLKVLVTGATRGIGKSIAEKYKKEGYYVIGTGSTPFTAEYLDEYLSCNFIDPFEVEMLSQYVKDQKIDILINNAGINIINNFCDINPSDFDKMHRVNVYTPFRISQAALPNMVEKGWGRIVSVSSVWGKISKQGRASYSATKFAIDGLTLSMANEFASQGILCNSVSPGFIDTSMTWNNLGEEGVRKMLEAVPIKRLAKVEEIAKFIFMLGSEENTYISGQNISIDGGFTRA
jgi:NAD(P)-dependent dehydrogenase (short-subunit alcohol dehydrogenase family)